MSKSDAATTGELTATSPRTNHQLKLLQGLGVTTPNSSSPQSPVVAMERLHKLSQRLSEIAEITVIPKRNPRLGDQLGTHSDIVHSHGHLALHPPGHEAAHSYGSPFDFDKS